MVSSSPILALASSSRLRSVSFSPPIWAPMAENSSSSSSSGVSGRVVPAGGGVSWVSAGLLRARKAPNFLIVVIPLAPIRPAEATHRITLAIVVMESVHRFHLGRVFRRAAPAPARALGRSSSGACAGHQYLDTMATYLIRRP